MESLSGTIPDGGFAVSGHEDAVSASIGVTRLSVTGIAVAGTNSHALKSFTARPGDAEEAIADAEQA